MTICSWNDLAPIPTDWTEFAYVPERWVAPNRQYHPAGWSIWGLLCNKEFELDVREQSRPDAYLTKWWVLKANIDEKSYPDAFLTVWVYLEVNIDEKSYQEAFLTKFIPLEADIEEWNCPDALLTKWWEFESEVDEKNYPDAWLSKFINVYADISEECNAERAYLEVRLRFEVNVDQLEGVAKAAILVQDYPLIARVIEFSGPHVHTWNEVFPFWVPEVWMIAYVSRKGWLTWSELWGVSLSHITTIFEFASRVVVVEDGTHARPWKEHPFKIVQDPLAPDPPPPPGDDDEEEEPNPRIPGIQGDVHSLGGDVDPHRTLQSKNVLELSTKGWAYLRVDYFKLFTTRAKSWLWGIFRDAPYGQRDYAKATLYYLKEVSLSTLWRFGVPSIKEGGFAYLDLIKDEYLYAEVQQVDITPYTRLFVDVYLSTQKLRPEYSYPPIAQGSRQTSMLYVDKKESLTAMVEERSKTEAEISRTSRDLKGIVIQTQCVYVRGIVCYPEDGVRALTTGIVYDDVSIDTFSE